MTEKQPEKADAHLASMVSLSESAFAIADLLEHQAMSGDLLAFMDGTERARVILTVAHLRVAGKSYRATAKTFGASKVASSGELDEPLAALSLYYLATKHKMNRDATKKAD